MLSLPALLMSASFALCNSSNDEEKILIEERPFIPNGTPRSSSSTNIEAYYDTEAQCVYISLYDAGAFVNVVINNLTTNETVSCNIPGIGSSIIPISGDSGYWTIVLTLEDGRVYEGFFLL